MTSVPGSSPSPRPSGARPTAAQPSSSPAQPSPAPSPARRSTTGRMPWTQSDGTAAAAAPRSRGAGISELSAALLETLRCPLTRGRLLVVDEHHLMSELPHLEGIHPVYEIVDGIPHLLPAQGLENRGQR